MTRQTYDRAPRLTRPPTAHISRGDNVLVHDMNLPERLACDASSYGLSAVISHVMHNGEERPIDYASRTLSASEKNYAQIEKEALSFKKFHIYLYGCKFTLITDHKPLTAILGPKTSIPTLAAARMQRWALILSAHPYEIYEYRSSSQHANADALSRLPNMSVPAKSEEAGIRHSRLPAGNALWFCQNFF